MKEQIVSGEVLAVTVWPQWASTAVDHGSTLWQTVLRFVKIHGLIETLSLEELTKLEHVIGLGVPLPQIQEAAFHMGEVNKKLVMPLALPGCYEDMDSSVHCLAREIRIALYRGSWFNFPAQKVVGRFDWVGNSVHVDITPDVMHPDLDHYEYDLSTL